MKIVVTELKGDALDYAVAQALGLDVVVSPTLVVAGQTRRKAYPAILTEYVGMTWPRVLDYSTAWRAAGPLIARFGMSLIRTTDLSGRPNGWRAGPFGDDMLCGDTALEAVCRAAVAMHHRSKTVEIDIPEELIPMNPKGTST